MSSSKPPPRDEAGRARRLARQYLRFGVRSIQELRAHLQASQVSERTAASVIAACARQGLVDDRACAKLWAAKLADRGYAWATVREQLLEKGLEPRVVAQVLAPLAAREPDAVRARLLLERERDRGRAARARWARLLARRGFEPDLIAQVLADSPEPVSAD